MNTTRTALVATALLAALLPSTSHAEGCDLYQKWTKDLNGTLCADTTTPLGLVPSGGTGNLIAVNLPLCADGTYTSCTAPETTCMDGTNAVFHIDPGTGPDANRWVFVFLGGAVCPLGANPSLSVVEECLNVYDDDRLVTSTAHADGTTAVTRYLQGAGILSDAPANPFSTWSRVLVPKCAYDLYAGSTYTKGDIDGDSVFVRHHGRGQVSAVLQTLAGSNGPIVVDGQLLPDLSEATDVILAGNSSGAMALKHNGDEFARQVTGISPEADVSLALDSFWGPTPEGEAFFATTGSLPFYDGIYSSTSIIVDPGLLGGVQALTSAPWTFYPTGLTRQILDTWGDATSSSYLDDSCFDHHDFGVDAYKCFDEGHVAMHHLEQDVFVFQSLDDDVLVSLPWVFLSSPLRDPFVFDGPVLSFRPAFSARSARMATELWSNRGLSDEGGFGQKVGLYMTDGTFHTSLLDDDAFFVHTMEQGSVQVTYGQALLDWHLGTADTCHIDDDAVPPLVTMPAECTGWEFVD